jgi:hypothetical protein
MSIEVHKYINILSHGTCATHKTLIVYVVLEV